MKYLINWKDAAYNNAEVLTKSDEVYSIPLEMAPKADAFDDFVDGAINPALWETIGTVTEEKYPSVTGKDCLNIEGPATSGWDSGGVIYKPAIVPTIGSVVFCRFIINNSCAFAVGLQEYDFTGAPGSYALKLDQAQSINNSTYLFYRAGEIQIIRGGVATGQKISIMDSCWKSTIVDGEVVYPITVAFAFTATGYLIFAHQFGVWDEPRLIHTEERASLSQPANGYSFCVNKLQPLTPLGFYDLANTFKSGTIVSGGRIIVPSKETILLPRTLNLVNTPGGMIGQTGVVLVQFPEDPANGYKWFTLDELAQTEMQIANRYAHEIRLQMAGDIVVKHGSVISDTNEGAAS